MTQDEASILSGSIRMQEVLHYLISRDGIWDVADFIARSRKPKELQKSELNKIIQQLENGKMIRWDKGKYIIEKTEFYQDTTNTEGIFHAAQKAYAKGYQDFLDDRYAPWTDLFGTVLIPRDRLPEVYDRLAGIRNYLYEIRGQTLLKDPNAKFEVFQFSINLFSVFRRNLTK